MSRHVLGRRLQAECPVVFRLNPTAPADAPRWSDRWVDDGWVRLCESSDPAVLRWAAMTYLRERP